MKLEVVVSRWNDGLFKRRYTITDDNLASVQIKFKELIEKIASEIIEEEEKRRKIMEDDDIPF